MSAVKSKFAGLLRGLLRHFEDNDPVVTNDEEFAAPAALAVAAAPQPAPARVDSRPSAPPAPAYVAPPAPKAPAKVPEPKQKAVDLPLQPIIASLPLELRAKITSPAANNGTISVPVEKVINQLAAGSVKISFGELRQLAPAVFANYGGEHDARAVALPLNQILAQVNPAMLPRRNSQKRIDVSDDVAGPFETPAASLKVSVEKAKASPPPPVEPVPLSRFAGPVAERNVQPPPVVPPPAFAPRWNTPAANGSNGNGSANGSKKDGGVPAAPQSTRASGLVTPPPAAANAGRMQQSSGEQQLLVPLAALFENWPDALKMEISQLDLENAQVALPANLIEPALKRGRVAFPWRDVRSWIQSAAVAVSVHDSKELELPLKVLAPLFFARQKQGAAGPKSITPNEDIPDMFFGNTPPPAPVAPPVPTLPSAVAAAAPRVDTNFILRSVQPSASDSEFIRKGGSESSAPSASPADIVARAVALPGVAGALITLPDGLKVASEVPAELNGETLAAFIPQIFNRVNQGSRELRMGELNNLSFTVGSVPWRIFRVNSVYFAAFGRKNEGLPGAPLAKLAVELDHKK